MVEGGGKVLQEGGGCPERSERFLSLVTKGAYALVA